MRAIAICLASAVIVAPIYAPASNEVVTPTEQRVRDAERSARDRKWMPSLRAIEAALLLADNAEGTSSIQDRAQQLSIGRSLPGPWPTNVRLGVDQNEFIRAVNRWTRTDCGNQLSQVRIFVPDKHSLADASTLFDFMVQVPRHRVGVCSAVLRGRWGIMATFLDNRLVGLTAVLPRSVSKAYLRRSSEAQFGRDHRNVQLSVALSSIGVRETVAGDAWYSPGTLFLLFRPDKGDWRGILFDYRRVYRIGCSRSQIPAL